MQAVDERQKQLSSTRGRKHHRSLEERFWERVVKQDDGCWIFASCRRGSYGYASLWTADGMLAAHRLSWRIHFGEIPNDMKVLHHCDVPTCVNPSHLFLGTCLDNTRDMIRKGREARGEASGPNKLTEAEVIEIRRLYATGEYSQRALAAKFGVTQGAVAGIHRKRNWAWLKS